MVATEEEILAKLMPHFKKAEEEPICGEKVDLPEFSLDDLVGKTIANVHKIENPSVYKKKESPNPRYFNVMFFLDGSYLLHADISWQDGSTLHSFLVEGKNIRYTSRLYKDF